MKFIELQIEIELFKQKCMVMNMVIAVVSIPMSFSSSGYLELSFFL
jgi:hypothetical protein